MPIASVLTVAGTPYASSGRVAAAVAFTSLERTLDGGYDTLTFAELSQSPVPAFHESQSAELAIDIGSGSLTRFKGEIVDRQSSVGEAGWVHGYTALGLKYLGDRVPVTAVDGTGQQVYNRSPEDEYYVTSDAGLTIGEMFERILTNISTGQRLNAVGVGNYTGLPSSPTLPASTLADLAALTVVPPRPVAWGGESIFNVMDQELSQWMPKWYLEIEPTGDIRVKDSTDIVTYFPPQTLTLGGLGGPGDPVTPPRVRSSTQNCATRLVIRGGPQVEVAALSLVDGTLAEVFTSGDKTAWNLTYFTAPKGSSDYGTVTANTSTSATLQSHDATATWATNFWASNEAVVTLIDPVISGVDTFEARIVTSNNALTAGGTSTVNWDATWPVTGSSFAKYRIVGQAGGLSDTWRTYTPRDPNTGNTGLSTFVGSHLVVRSAHVVKVANVAGTTGQYYPTGVVVGGSLGQAFPLPLQPVPSEGIFRFTQPTVTVFGNTAYLNTQSPTDNAHGLPDDVIIYAFYSRGPLSVTAPPDVAGMPQYEGTAYTDKGLPRTLYLDFSAWNWANDTASFAQLAQEHLDCRKNTEIDIDIDWVDRSSLPAWDFLSFGYSLNIDVDGGTSPWSALNAPIRTIGVRWDRSTGSLSLSFGASTRRRAFAGDDLYLHPEFAAGTALTSATSRLVEDDRFQGNYREFGQMLAAGFVPQMGEPVGLPPADMAGAFGMPDFEDFAGGGGMAPRRRRRRPPEEDEAPIRPKTIDELFLEKSREKRDPVAFRETPESRKHEREMREDKELALARRRAGAVPAGEEKAERDRRDLERGRQIKEEMDERIRRKRIEARQFAREAQGTTAAARRQEAIRAADPQLGHEEWKKQADRALDEQIRKGREREVMEETGRQRDIAREKRRREKILEGAQGEGIPFRATE